MKKLTALICMCTFLLANRSNAQTEAEMKAWQTYMTPGEVHKMLAAGDGEWNEEITMWVAPGAPLTKTMATAKAEMIMGGRYQLSKVTGSMMGMPFEGMLLMGYDNAKKVFTSTYVDNFGTGTTTMDGTWDDKTKSISFKGKSLDPMTGKDMMMKQVMKFIDNDTQSIEIFDNKTGKDAKTVEIKMTRKK